MTLLFWFWHRINTVDNLKYFPTCFCSFQCHCVHARQPEHIIPNCSQVKKKLLLEFIKSLRKQKRTLIYKSNTCENIKNERSKIPSAHSACYCQISSYITTMITDSVDAAFRFLKSVDPLLTIQDWLETTCPMLFNKRYLACFCGGNSKDQRTLIQSRNKCNKGMIMEANYHQD